MMETAKPSPVGCDFFDLDAEIVLRVTSALVDQICAHADVDVALLAAIEIPIVELVDALTRASSPIRSVQVTVEPDQILRIDVTTDLSSDVSPIGLLGDSLDLVEAYFDEEVSVGLGGLRLRGRLG